MTVQIRRKSHLVIEVWLNNKVTVIIQVFFCIGTIWRLVGLFQVFQTTKNNMCVQQLFYAGFFPKWTPWKTILHICSVQQCRSYFFARGEQQCAFASKPSAINGKCYNSWVVVVVLSCSPFFASHPQSQFGKAHSTRPTSLVTRVVLTSVASNATKRSGGKQMSSSRRTWWQLETRRVIQYSKNNLMIL